MKKALIFVMTLFACAFGEADTAGHHAQHGFQILGTRQIHLYHLARFDSPHEYQALTEVKLLTSEGAELDLEAMRTSLPPEAKGQMAIVSSDPDTLPELLQRSEFRADLFSGYLRDKQHSTLLLTDIRVKVITNRFFKEIQSQEAPSKRLNMVLVCDKGTGAIFGVHEVFAKPSFEEIISMTALYEPGDLEADIPSVVHPCSDQVQGSRYEVVARPDRPLEQLEWIHGYASGLSRSVSLAGVERLLLDTESINR